jgi:hypothetical protein
MPKEAFYEVQHHNAFQEKSTIDNSQCLAATCARNNLDMAVSRDNGTGLLSVRDIFDFF